MLHVTSNWLLVPADLQKSVLYLETLALNLLHAKHSASGRYASGCFPALAPLMLHYFIN